MAEAVPQRFSIRAGSGGKTAPQTVWRIASGKKKERLLARYRPIRQSAAKGKRLGNHLSREAAVIFPRLKKRHATADRHKSIRIRRKRAEFCFKQTSSLLHIIQILGRLKNSAKDRELHIHILYVSLQKLYDTKVSINFCVKMLSIYTDEEKVRQRKTVKSDKNLFF